MLAGPPGKWAKLAGGPQRQVEAGSVGFDFRSHAEDPHNRGDQTRVRTCAAPWRQAPGWKDRRANFARARNPDQPGGPLRFRGQGFSADCASPLTLRAGLSFQGSKLRDRSELLLAGTVRGPRSHLDSRALGVHFLSLVGGRRHGWNPLLGDGAMAETAVFSFQRAPGARAPPRAEVLLAQGRRPLCWRCEAGGHRVPPGSGPLGARFQRQACGKLPNGLSVNQTTVLRPGPGGPGLGPGEANLLRFLHGSFKKPL